MPQYLNLRSVRVSALKLPLWIPTVLFAIGSISFILIPGGEMQNGKWMRQGDFKAVSVAPPYGLGSWKLYNVVNDPGETRDLAKEQPRMLRELQAAWERYTKDVGVVLSE